LPKSRQGGLLQRRLRIDPGKRRDQLAAMRDLPPVARRDQLPVM
jgi:hypothetical protein